MGLRNFGPEELAELLRGLPQWEPQGDAITRTFRFASFSEAIAFVNDVAAAAEALDHHPDIDIRYTTVRLACSTHVTRGVTERDLALARAADEAAQPRLP